MPKRRGHGGGTVTRRPDGRWQVAVTVGVDARGRQKRKYAYARTKAEAERKLLELLVKYGAGQAADPGRVTLAEHLERWLAYKESRVKPTTLAGYTNLVRNHIVPEIGQVRLARLNAYHVEQLYQAMLARGLSARMVNLAHVVLNNALGLAVRWGTLDRNPAAAVDPPRPTPTEPSYWTPEQAVAFLEAARGHRLYALFYLALVTGMRRGELLGLQWPDVDLERGVLQIQRNLTVAGGRVVLTTPKSARSRRGLYLSREAAAVLREHHRRQAEERERAGSLWRQDCPPWVFASTVGTYTMPRNLYRTFKALIEGAGVPEIRFHDLRHTYVSLERARGTQIELISSRVGHSRVSFTLQAYRHLYEPEERDVLTLAELGGVTSK